MPRDSVPSEVQHALLKVLWERKEASVADVHAAVKAERGLAPTTIATLLQRMEKKGLVTHRVEGRQFIYRGKVSEEAVRAALLSQVTERLFDGDVAALLNHLIEERDIDRQDLHRLRSLIARREKE